MPLILCVLNHAKNPSSTLAGEFFAYYHAGLTALAGGTSNARSVGHSGEEQEGTTEEAQYKVSHIEAGVEKEKVGGVVASKSKP